MNIKITHNWLLEYLETDATPYEIQNYLSLCGPSIESVTQAGNDFVYDIEVISNRIDYASVIGIAREASAILPMFGKKTKLKKDYLTYDRSIDNNLDFKLEIIDPENLCPRKLAIVMDVKIADSPKYIKERLENCGIRSLNNLIDVTNYVMLEVGHPAHVFDYDRVKTGKILIRKAKKGEKITTLDGKNYILNSEDVIFDDGTGRIIDLPGIMGLENSVVTERTKRIIFWIETNDPKSIRKTSMRLGIRTVAASINEKNPDTEAAKKTFLKGIELYQKIAKAKILSPLYDTNPKPEKQKILNINYEIFDKLIGIKIEKSLINKILNNLGFIVGNDPRVVHITVPSFRTNDINIPEDLVEEVARIYGYNNIPSILQPPTYVDQPKNFEDIFLFQNKIKLLLKHLGLNEVINYSMVSKSMIEDGGLKIEDHLRLSNSISEDIEYLRISLLPSLYKDVKDNSGKKEVMRFFEIAKVYWPRKNDLPDEVYKIGIAANTDHFDLKGIIEAVYKELNIDVGNKNFCSVPEIIEKDGIFMAEIDLQKLINNYHQIPKYKPINPYAVIKLDKTFDLRANIKFAPTSFAQIKKIAFEKSKLLQKIEVVTLYQNKLTLRFYYSSSERNITEEEAKAELNKVRP
jgi:phenylalanyl-tRNA synthetase beta chain